MPGRPYLSAFQVNDAPKESDRDSLGVTLDFRLSARDRIASARVVPLGDLPAA